MADETAADDGAVHLLWRFITARRLRADVVQYDLDDVDQLRAAAADALAHAGEFDPGATP